MRRCAREVRIDDGEQITLRSPGRLRGSTHNDLVVLRVLADDLHSEFLTRV